MGEEYIKVFSSFDEDDLREKYNKWKRQVREDGDSIEIIERHFSTCAVSELGDSHLVQRFSYCVTYR